MADPISVFPLFVKDQVYPPTSSGGGDGLAVTVASSTVAVAVSTPAVIVTVEGSL